MRDFFDPSIDSIIEMVESQMIEADHNGRAIKVSKINGLNPKSHVK
jgi:hypothetical protein